MHKIRFKDKEKITFSYSYNPSQKDSLLRKVNKAYQQLTRQTLTNCTQVNSFTPSSLTSTLGYYILNHIENVKFCNSYNNRFQTF